MGAEKTIMIVDDEMQLLELTARMLKKAGYKTLTASAANDAIAQFKLNRDRIDLVLMDMLMPGMNGEKVHNEMYNINPRVKTVFVTGNSRTNGGPETLPEGVMGLLEKPFGMQELVEMIENATKS